MTDDASEPWIAVPCANPSCLIKVWIPGWARDRSTPACSHQCAEDAMALDNEEAEDR